MFLTVSIVNVEMTDSVSIIIRNRVILQRSLITKKLTQISHR